MSWWVQTFDWHGIIKTSVVPERTMLSNKGFFFLLQPFATVEFKLLFSRNVDESCVGTGACLKEVYYSNTELQRESVTLLRTDSTVMGTT